MVAETDFGQFEDDAGLDLFWDQSEEEGVLVTTVPATEMLTEVLPRALHAVPASRVEQDIPITQEGEGTAQLLAQLVVELEERGLRLGGRRLLQPLKGELNKWDRIVSTVAEEKPNYAHKLAVHTQFRAATLILTYPNLVGTDITQAILHDQSPSTGRHAADAPTEELVSLRLARDLMKWDEELCLYPEATAAAAVLLEPFEVAKRRLAAEQQPTERLVVPLMPRPERVSAETAPIVGPVPSQDSQRVFGPVGSAWNNLQMAVGPFMQVTAKGLETPITIDTDVIKDQETVQQLIDGFEELMQYPIVVDHQEVKDDINRLVNYGAAESIPNPLQALNDARARAAKAEEYYRKDNLREIDSFLKGKPGFSLFVAEHPEEKLVINNLDEKPSVRLAWCRAIWKMKENRTEMYLRYADTYGVPEAGTDSSYWAQKIRRAVEERAEMQTREAIERAAMAKLQANPDVPEESAPEQETNVTPLQPRRVLRDLDLRPRDAAVSAPDPSSKMPDGKKAIVGWSMSTPLPGTPVTETAGEHTDSPEADGIEFSDAQIEQWFKRFVEADKSFVERFGKRGLRGLTLEQKAEMVASVLPDILATLTAEPGKAKHGKFGVDLLVHKRKNQGEGLDTLHEKLGLKGKEEVNNG